MGGTLPMQQPEGAQAAQPDVPANDGPEPAPEAGDNQDVDPEPQELLHCKGLGASADQSID